VTKGGKERGGEGKNRVVVKFLLFFSNGANHPLRKKKKKRERNPVKGYNKRVKVPQKKHHRHTRVKGGGRKKNNPIDKKTRKRRRKKFQEDQMWGSSPATQGPCRPKRVERETLGEEKKVFRKKSGNRYRQGVSEGGAPERVQAGKNKEKLGGEKGGGEPQTPRGFPGPQVKGKAKEGWNHRRSTRG